MWLLLCNLLTWEALYITLLNSTTDTYLYNFILNQPRISIIPITLFDIPPPIYVYAKQFRNSALTMVNGFVNYMHERRHPQAPPSNESSTGWPYY